jgi:hypothetical protein
LGAFALAPSAPIPISFYRKYFIPNKLFSVKNIQGMADEDLPHPFKDDLSSIPFTENNYISVT